MSFALPMQSAKSKYDALKLSFDAMELGADSIICGTWGVKFIEAVAHAGIPTEGHIGLVPRRSTWTGGFKAVGKTLEQAKKLYDDIKRFKYLKRLFRRYKLTGEIKVRLIVNHVIVLQNVFGVEAACVLLLYKIDEQYWSILKTVLNHLEYLYPHELKDVEIDTNIKKLLEEM